jgi:hypothetical protein
LHALGDAAPRNLTLHNAISRIELLLRMRSVELLIVDECQRLIGERNVCGPRDTGAILQWLLRDMRLPTVFVGTTRYRELLGQMDWLRSSLQAVVVVRADPASSGGRP